MSSTHEQASGLTIQPDDCEVTTVVRAALYASRLEPTEDDVIGMVAAINEDLIEVTRYLVILRTTFETLPLGEFTDLQDALDLSAKLPGDMVEQAMTAVVGSVNISTPRYVCIVTMERGRPLGQIHKRPLSLTEVERIIGRPLSAAHKTTDPNND